MEEKGVKWSVFGDSGKELRIKRMMALVVLRSEDSP
jgi:hypothetical protein